MVNAPGRAFWKQNGSGSGAEGASIEALDAPMGWGCWGGTVPSTLGGAVPCPEIFHFRSSKSLVLLHFECYYCKFVYDGWVALGRCFWLDSSGKQ